MLNRDGLALLCSFFVDDLILFAEASMSKVLTIKEILDDLYACSGQ